MGKIKVLFIDDDIALGNVVTVALITRHPL